MKLHTPKIYLYTPCTYITGRNPLPLREDICAGESPDLEFDGDAPEDDAYTLLGGDTIEYWGHSARKGVVS